MQTGKFSADHVLSAFVEQDCVLTRPLTGDEMCHDIDPESDAAGERVVVAAYPGDRDTGSFRSNSDPEVSLGAMVIDGVKEPTLVATALPYSAPVRAPIETPGLTSTEATVLAAPKAAPTWMPPVPIARPVTHSRSADVVASVQDRRGSVSKVSAPIDPWTPPANYVRGHRGVSSVTAKAPDAEQRYVVIGSVSDIDRAMALAERFAHRKAEIRPVDVEGRTWYRVLVGPYASSDAHVAKSDLGIVDGRQPWIIRATPHADQVAMR